MDPLALLLNLSLLAVVVYLVARPLLRQGRAPAPRPDPAAQLAAERERLLAALRDLELDHLTGKVAAEDYARQRPLLVAQGAAVLRQLDTLGHKPAARAPRPAAALDDEIEAAVRQMRQGRRQSGSQPAARGTCPACGQAAQPQDRFCAGCGAPLAPAARRPKGEAVP